MNAITVTGATEVMAQLSRLNVDVNARVMRQVETSALAIEAGAKQRVPKKTGELESTIRHKITRGGFAAQIMAGFGDIRKKTGKGKAGKGAQAPVIEFGGRKSKAEPFMFPSLEAERPRFVAGVDAALKGAVSAVAS